MALRAPAPVHYLRPNDTVWSPPAVIYADTETRTEAREGYDLERLRLWCAHYVDRRTRAGVAPRDEWADGDTADQLADWIGDVTRNRETVWCYFHNLAFDLTATRLPVQLVARGWSVTDAAIGGKAPWMRLARGKRVLTLADSWSWLPAALGEIGKTVGVAKPRLPSDRQGRAAWLARCRADVTILEAAIGALMDWWDAERLGRWTISGAGCGWNAYRHKQPTRTVQRRRRSATGWAVETRKEAIEPVTVDPDPVLVAADRLAVHGGRRGTWRIGEHGAGPFTELDLVAAYPTVAATLPLPLSRARAFDSLPVDDPVLSSSRWGVVATVRVQTDVPRWPVRAAGGTWYPVGDFWCDLAGPDIAEAARLGCLREVGPGQVHRLGFNMQPWARWVLSVQTGAAGDVPAVARVAAKSWGRSVIGKWASRGYTRLPLGPAPGDGWGYEDGFDHSDGVPGGVVDLAGQRFWVSSGGVSDNAYPAVLAWVESYVRVRLNRAVEALGPGAVLQCDTDGLIVADRVVATPAAHGTLSAPAGARAGARLAAAVEQLGPLVAPLSIRAKVRHDHVTVLGPQHLRLDGARRFAGLPGTATEDAPGSFTAKLWPGLQWQLAHGDRAGYVRPVTHPKVTGPWPTGWLLADGRVVPVECVVRADGSTRVLGWNSSSYPRRGLVPADVQHPGLAALL